MEQRKLGRQGLEVSAVGLGCAAMSGNYGTVDEVEARAAIHEAIERGVTLLDTSDVYGHGKNESFVGAAIQGMRERVIIATKFGNMRTPDGVRGKTNGRPEYVPQACDASLKRLGIDVIDLYYQHRIDPQVPIEETVGAMGRLVEAGKVRYIGLSEAGAETIRRAHKTFPLTAIQTEYSLWTRDVETTTLPTLRELGIGLVPYSPLGRGFLSGTIRRPEDMATKDRRHEHPRFEPENLERNVGLLAALEAIAESRGVSMAQIALSWLLAQGESIVPIPGTKRRKYLAQNTSPVVLSVAEVAQLSQAFPPGAAAGLRYPEFQLKGMGI